jgi:hypothetical protein
VRQAVGRVGRGVEGREVDLPTAIEKDWAHMVALATAAGWAITKRLEDRAKSRADAITSAAARQVAKLDLVRLVREETADSSSASAKR